MPRQIGERDLRAVFCPARPPARESSAISPREMPTPAGNPPRFFRRCPEPFSPGGAQRFQSGCGDAARALKNSRCAAIFSAIRPIPWPGPSKSIGFYCKAIKTSFKRAGDPQGSAGPFCTVLFQGRRPQADAFPPQRALERSTAPARGDGGERGRDSARPPLHPA